jgi:hypothetical protein
MTSKTKLSKSQKEVIELMRKGFWMDYYECKVRHNNKRITLWHPNDPNYRQIHPVPIPTFKSLQFKKLIFTRQKHIPLFFRLTKLGRSISLD